MNIQKLQGLVVYDIWCYIHCENIFNLFAVEDMHTFEFANAMLLEIVNQTSTSGW